MESRSNEEMDPVPSSQALYSDDLRNEIPLDEGLFVPMPLENLAKIDVGDR